MWRSIACELPEYIDKTAALGEILAVLMATRAAPEESSITIYSDCQAVANNWHTLHGPKVFKYNRANNGLWRQIREEAQGKNIQVLKTKAHRSVAEAKAVGQHVEWEGNDKADSEASPRTGSCSG